MSTILFKQTSQNSPKNSARNCPNFKTSLHSLSIVITLCLLLTLSPTLSELDTAYPPLIQQNSLNFEGLSIEVNNFSSAIVDLPSSNNIDRNNNDQSTQSTQSTLDFSPQQITDELFSKIALVSSYVETGTDQGLPHMAYLRYKIEFSNPDHYLCPLTVQVGFDSVLLDVNSNDGDGNEEEMDKNVQLQGLYKSDTETPSSSISSSLKTGSQSQSPSSSLPSHHYTSLLSSTTEDGDTSQFSPQQHIHWDDDSDYGDYIELKPTRSPGVVISMQPDFSPQNGHNNGRNNGHNNGQNVPNGIFFNKTIDILSLPHHIIPIHNTTSTIPTPGSIDILSQTGEFRLAKGVMEMSGDDVKFKNAFFHQKPYFLTISLPLTKFTFPPHVDGVITINTALGVEVSVDASRSEQYQEFNLQGEVQQRPQGRKGQEEIVLSTQQQQQRQRQQPKITLRQQFPSVLKSTTPPLPPSPSPFGIIDMSSATPAYLGIQSRFNVSNTINGKIEKEDDIALITQHWGYATTYGALWDLFIDGDVQQREQRLVSQFEKIMMKYNGQSNGNNSNNDNNNNIDTLSSYPASSQLPFKQQQTTTLPHQCTLTAKRNNTIIVPLPDDITTNASTSAQLTEISSSSIVIELSSNYESLNGVIDRTVQCQDKVLPGVGKREMPLFYDWRLIDVPLLSTAVSTPPSPFTTSSLVEKNTKNLSSSSFFVEQNTQSPFTLLSAPLSSFPLDTAILHSIRTQLQQEEDEEDYDEEEFSMRMRRGYTNVTFFEKNWYSVNKIQFPSYISTAIYTKSFPSSFTTMGPGGEMMSQSGGLVLKEYQVSTVFVGVDQDEVIAAWRHFPLSTKIGIGVCFTILAIMYVIGLIVGVKHLVAWIKVKMKAIEDERKRLEEEESRLLEEQKNNNNNNEKLKNKKREEYGQVEGENGTGDSINKSKVQSNPDQERGTLSSIPKEDRNGDNGYINSSGNDKLLSTWVQFSDGSNTGASNSNPIV